MRQTIPLLCAMFLVGTSAAGAEVLATSASGPLRCEIRRVGTVAGASLTAHLSAEVAFEGDSRFVVTKSGPAGSSTINQNGRVRVAAGGEAALGAIALSLEPRSHAQVELQVRAVDGLECHVEARLGE